ncbi:MAG: 23S rRNA pseudouridine(1911/1915/1917) synthase RluD [Pseudomonadota bacterium]
MERAAEGVEGRVILSTMQSNDFEDDDYSLALPANAARIAETVIVKVPLSLSGSRLDAALASLFPDFSRSRLAVLVKSGDIRVNGMTAQPKTKLIGSETIEANLKPRDEDNAFQAEDLALDVVFEDNDVIVINKPPDLVVHPAAGNWSGTVLNGILFRYPETASVPRAGIVHRLDKDTSGLMVIARNEAAQLALVRQLQAHSVSRRYAALVRGHVLANGTVNAPIGRHPRERIKMSVVNSFGAGKPAITHYRIEEKFQFHTLVECQLETGRTHQIRVHMASIGFPLEGDSVYGKGLRGLTPLLHEAVTTFGRQALHAKALAFEHPKTKKLVEFESPIPDDMETLIQAAADL